MEKPGLETNGTTEEYPDLETARQREAVRRLWCLGLLASADVDAKSIQQRARQIWVPPKALLDWRRCYLAKGVEGLLPDNWPEVSPDGQEVIHQRFEQLGQLAHAETITWTAVANQAKIKGCSKRTMGRWLSRYRTRGMLGLLYGKDPQGRLSSAEGTSRLLPEPGSLTEAGLAKIHDRREILGELAEREHLTNKEVKDRADETQVSERAIWNYWRDFRTYGFLGLAPQHRSDQDRHYKISPKMVGIVEGIRLSHVDFPVRATWEEACKRAHLLGEVEPTLWQVRSIIQDIPDAVKFLADRREKEFRNHSRLTHRVDWSGLPCTVLIDHVHPLHILVKDIRSAPWCVATGEVRPHMCLALERGSRLVPAVRFSYDPADRFIVGACIRDLLRTSPLKPFVTPPYEAWVDNGKDLVSNYVWQLTKGLGIILHPCFPHDPEARGVLERFFETLNTRLLAKLPGYTGSNPTVRNPRAKAELTLAQLAAEIEAFLVTYNHEEHTALGQSPWAYWEEHFVEDPPDERMLDMLLKEPDTRVIVKECIKYEGRLYWDKAFAELANEVVEVRAAPFSYSAPDELEVFFEKRHICTAKAIDSPAGRAVTPQHIAQAQHHQRTWARGKIRQARDTLQAVDQQLAKAGHELSVLQTASTPAGSPPASDAPAPSRPTQPGRAPEEEERDLWDDLLEQEGSEEH